MTLTKTIEIGKMEIVTEHRQIQVRTDTVVKEDGKELSRNFHRHVVQPHISAEDLLKEHADVQAIANSGIWTQEVKNSWAAKLEADDNKYKVEE